MESTEELQQQEITALKSIYGDDFQEVPAPKAWKVRSAFLSLRSRRAERACPSQGAGRLPEFMIKVTHPEDVHGTKCYLSLLVT